MVREDDRPARVPFVRWANVFNLDQTEGIEAPKIEAAQNIAQPLEQAASIVENANLCPIHHAGFSAVYSPKEDEIRLPAPATFRSMEDYYQTLFHEMIHATGHEKRLNREGITQPVKFGSERYSKEELVAELGAAFLSNEAGILDQVQFDNSAAYLNSWIQKLENDPKIIVSAASQAQRSADFVLGIELGESQQEGQIAEISVADAPEHELVSHKVSIAHNGIETPRGPLARKAPAQQEVFKPPIRQSPRQGMGL